ncbi:hypothetical protein OL305_004584 [Vibrio parahaemolyticus]|nr:hypothetical protein [Vibrio parahaemolyticus]HCM0916169.1 hypothetical protein [Vibrio parahaemolyticus]
MFFNKKSSKPSPNLVKLGQQVHLAYKNSAQSTVNKDDIKTVVLSFHELYKHVAEEVHDSYFLGNLIKTGKIEGTKEEVLGTIDDAVERTISFIDNSQDLTTSQCEFFARNLKEILEKHSFTKPVEDILENYLNTLNLIAH